jgi:hypothetical protein
MVGGIEMALTSKRIEKKYNCQVFRDKGFDGSGSYWVACENGDNEDEKKFIYADGWNLVELVENIETEMNSNARGI